ncbi:MAG: hypothetical protein RRB13_02905 [bacterium]|nr:hypothetical protein [bacterium]
MGSQLAELGRITESTWASRFDMGLPGAWGGITRSFDWLVIHGLSLFGGSLVAKWLPWVYAVIGAVGFFRLGQRIGLKVVPAILLALLTQFNPRIYSELISGHHFQLGFAYSLWPWALLCALYAWTTPGWRAWAKGSLAAALLLSLACAASPMAIALTGLIFGLFGLFHLRTYPLRVLLSGVLVLLVLIGTNAHWLGPAYLLSQTSQAGFKFNESSGSENVARFTSLFENYSAPMPSALLGHLGEVSAATEYVYPAPGIAWILSASVLLVLAGVSFFSSLPWRYRGFALSALILGVLLFAGAHTPLGRWIYLSVLLKVKVVFFLMSRTGRWLMLYYLGLSLASAMGLQYLTGRFPRAAKPLFAGLGLVLSIYLYPFWSGQLLEPKNNSSQTLSWMAQEITPVEAEVVDRVAANTDPSARVAILPSGIGPFGPIPLPAKDSLARNALLFGRDAVMAQPHTGSPWTQYLVSLAYRDRPYTDHFGALLGITAVQSIFLSAQEPQYSYFDFGHLHTPDWATETLYAVDDELNSLLTAQQDLKQIFDRPPVLGYQNQSYLPRVRLRQKALLAGGGLSALTALSNWKPEWIGQPTFFADQINPAQAAASSPHWAALINYGETPVELLQPWLDEAELLLPKAERGSGWSSAAAQWTEAAWLGDGGRNPHMLIGQAGAEYAFEFDCPECRIFMIYGALEDASFVVHNPESADRVVQSSQEGWAVLELAPTDQSLKVLSGSLVLKAWVAVSRPRYDALKAQLGQKFAQRVWLNEAENLAYQGKTLVTQQKIDLTQLVYQGQGDLRLIPWGGASDVGLGASDGTMAWQMEMERPWNNCILESYPRLFNDLEKTSFIALEVSSDGRNFQPLYRIESDGSGAWSGVYSTRRQDSFACPTQKVWFKATFKQSEFWSFFSGVNRPMTLRQDGYDGIVRSNGHAVSLPVKLQLQPFLPGTYRLGLKVMGQPGQTVGVDLLNGRVSRTLSKAGGEWLDYGPVSLEQPLDILVLGGPRDEVDLVALSNLTTQPEVDSDAVAFERLGSAEYKVAIQEPGILVFAESFNPLWALVNEQHTLTPLPVYGGLQAYRVGPNEIGSYRLQYQLQPLRRDLEKLTLFIFVGIIVLLGLILGWERLYSKTPSEKL